MSAATADRPNVLFVMTDQQRFDTIAALGNPHLTTPNLDRLVARGAVFDNAYSTCPVCVPARYTLHSGCEPTRTGIYDNTVPAGGHDDLGQRCGPYLAEAMRRRGYRTWGVGKFHTTPWDAPLGFDVQRHSEELYETAAQRRGDAYAAWIAAEHPEHDWVEGLMGERTDMYYMPQLSTLPADCAVESWATREAIALLDDEDQPRVDHGRARQPWFGFVSYIGPHPPFAPPLPYNRRYDPDRMPDPVGGELAVDHLDQQIPWMNHLVYAEDVDPHRARALKARYYGEISFIDECLGALLDAVQRRPDADDTVICFFSDHGDLLGDHHGWQKESFFEAAARVPLLISWPARIAAGQRRPELACLTDLFGVATTAAGQPDLRQGADLLGALGPLTRAPATRETLVGCHGRPGSPRFKAMVRQGSLKLIWLANGGHRLLFDLAADPEETKPVQVERSAEVERLTDVLIERLRADGVVDAFDGDRLRTFDYREWPLGRIQQFDRSRGVAGFGPDHR